MTLLDVAYAAVTAVMWLMFVAIAGLGVWFVYAFAAARRAEERAECAFAHPSNVTVVPYLRVFDFEVDA